MNAQTINEFSLHNFDSFLQALEIPASCKLNKPVYKKMFLDNGVLDATDKKCLKDDIEKIRWLYTLKPGTINIAPYHDEHYEYPEVAILHIELSSHKRFKRIAHFINRSIPYPLVLLFTCNIEGEACLLTSLADKRNNQADKEKWVIEESIQSPWIVLANQNEVETRFINSLQINQLSFKNFLEFYKTVTERVIAINCAIHTGRFSISRYSHTSKNPDRLVRLKEIENLETEKSEIKNKLKKEKQMAKQITLNTEIKKINDMIYEISKVL